MSEPEIVLGVSMELRRRSAKFIRGTVEGLALGLRDVLWSEPQIFDYADPLFLYVGGNRRKSEEPSLEVRGQTDLYVATLEIPESLQQRLEQVRSANLPGGQYAFWSCSCAEYCDQSHGLGRLEFEIRKPTFHELMSRLTAKGARTIRPKRIRSERRHHEVHS